MSSADKKKGCQMITGLQFPVKKLLAAHGLDRRCRVSPACGPLSRSQTTPISRTPAKLMGQSQTRRSLIIRLSTPAWCG